MSSRNKKHKCMTSPTCANPKISYLSFDLISYNAKLDFNPDSINRVLDNNINRRELRRAGRDFMRERQRLLDELMFANP